MDLVACLLRAVNVGGRRATNDALVAAAVDAGFDGARAYQAAGNLVVDAGGRSHDEVAATLSSALSTGLGFDVEVVLRDGPGLRTAVDGMPWTPAQVATAAGKPQVVLCRDEPGRDVAAEVLALAGDDDLLALHGRDLHWLPLGGTARSALDVARLSRLLDPSTARTVGTLDRLWTRFFAA